MLNLPYPISTNRYWRVFRNRTVLSSEAKAYKAQVAAIAKQSGQTLHHDDVEILITVQRKANKDGSASRVCLDLDNCLKVILDALQGIAYLNDKQIVLIQAQYADKPIRGGGVIVQVKKVICSLVGSI